MSVPETAVRRPVAVWMLALGLVLLGVVSYARLPIDLLPDVRYPRLVVHTVYPEVAPGEVERHVTEPLESAVATVLGAQRVTSISRYGVSVVTIRFAWGTDMDFAMLNVRESLDNVRGALPETAGRPTILRVDPESAPVMTLSVSGGESLWRTKELSEAVFRRRLEQLDGVARAAVMGGLDRQIRVEVERRRLESHDLTLEEISKALERANVSAPGGTILQGQYRYPLRTLGEFTTVDEIGGVVVSERSEGGAASIVRLSDVGRVVDGFVEREAIARYGGRESIGLLVYKESGANTVAVSRAVRAVLDDLSREYGDVSVEIADDQARFISDSIANVVQALLWGGILAFLVLFAFLREPRYPLAIAVAIPISVVGTFGLMDAFGVSLNIMSLGGLALGVGLLVDNSIVVLENIFRHAEERENDSFGAAAIGAQEVQSAITASTLTTIAVFAPIVYVDGVAGALFEDLFLTVAFSLLASLAVALTLLPSLAARLHTAAGPRAPVSYHLDAPLGRVFEPYHRTLEWSLDRPGSVIVAAALSLTLTVVGASALPRDLLPSVDQGAFSVQLTLPEGTSLTSTDAASRRVEHALLADPGIEAVFTHVGRDVQTYTDAASASGLHTARFEVRLGAGAKTRAVSQRVRALAALVPAGSLTVETGGATALGAILGGSEADIAVRVRGEGLELIHRVAARVAGRLGSSARLGNVRVASQAGAPQIHVEIDRDACASYGIEPRLVAETLERSMRGHVATEFVDFDRKIDIVVQYPDRERYARRTLETIRVNGVPLPELVTFRDATGPAEIRREDQGRVVPVHADVVRGGLDGAIADIEAILGDMELPAGVRLEVGGEDEEMRRSFRDLALAFGLAMALVYMILAAQFESFLHPVVILTAVPLALTGAVGALAGTGHGLNTMSLMGIVVLIGIVVNDAIVKVDFINQARRRGSSLRAAIMEAGRVRLRPILMTTATTVLGLTPMALGVGRGADLRAPLAIAVIGGLLVATVLTLIVVPVVYQTVEQARASFVSRPPHS